MWLKYIICSVFLVAINYCDIKYYKIKNSLVLPLIVIGFIFGIINGNILDCVYGMLIPLVLFPLYALRMLGAGDVKALCALGAVFGFNMSIQIMIFTMISGGIIALIFMLCNKNFIERFKYLFKYLKMCFLTRKLLKYDFGGEEKSYFRFSYAIITGTVLAVINVVYRLI